MGVVRVMLDVVVGGWCWVGGGCGVVVKMGVDNGGSGVVLEVAVVEVAGVVVV